MFTLGERSAHSLFVRYLQACSHSQHNSRTCLERFASSRTLKDIQLLPPSPHLESSLLLIINFSFTEVRFTSCVSKAVVLQLGPLEPDGSVSQFEGLGKAKTHRE